MSEVRSGGAEELPVLVVGVDARDEGLMIGSARGLIVTRVGFDPRAIDGAITRLNPGAAVVSMAGPDGSELPLRLVSMLARAGTRVIAYGRERDGDLVVRAMRAGAQEFVVPGEERLVMKALRPPQLSERAKVWTVLPARGGSGASVLATNLAALFAEGGERSCLVDLDLQFGSVAALLDIQAPYSVTDVIDQMERLDRDLLDASVKRHRSGVFVVAQGERIEDADRVEPKHLASLIEFMRSHYRSIVIDGIRNFSEHSLAVLDASDEIVLLTTQDLAAVRNVQKMAGLLRRIGVGDSRVRLVINRFRSNDRVTAPLISEATGYEVTSVLHDDPEATSEAANRGETVSHGKPGSPLAADLESLGKTLRGGAVAVSRSPSLIDRILRRGGGR